MSALNRGVRTVFVFGSLAVLGYAAWCGAAYLLQDKILFPCPRAAAPDPVAMREHGIERLWLAAGDGARVEAWYGPAPGRSAADPGPAVIFTHGNGELIDDWPGALEPYRRWGVSVLLPEYRGYGRSSGTPSEAAIVADMEQAFHWLAQRPEVDRSRIILHGRSLGGGVAAAFAARRPPAALILESTFTSMTAFFNRFALPSFVCTNPFATDRVVSALKSPILIFHGSRDEVVPVAHGRRLHELAPRSHYVEMDAGHNDFPPDRERYWARIRVFLAENGITGEQP
jgi:fermentation-respiration switch protein FrsA (DUF1100 family)